jgi:hypothetical protein
MRRWSRQGSGAEVNTGAWLLTIKGDVSARARVHVVCRMLKPAQVFDAGNEFPNAPNVTSLLTFRRAKFLWTICETLLEVSSVEAAQ